MLDNNMDKEEITKMVQEMINEATGFQSEKYGDTPTDANQLVPKKYVDQQTDFFSQAGSINSGVSTKVISHGLGGVPTVYGVSPTSDWYYSPTTTTYSVGITVDATNITLNKTPNNTITTSYIVWAKL